MSNQEAFRSRRAALVATAKETRAVLPAVIQQLPQLNPSWSEKLDLNELPALDPADCPGFRIRSNDGITSYGTSVKVINSDTLEAALQLLSAVAQQGRKTGEAHENSTSASASSSPAAERNSRVAVLNLASDKNPGGGWLSGASAQEEALCYRSSLSLSLHKSYYPWSPLTGLYTRDVIIVRSAMSSGHRLLVPQTPAGDLPVVSVISVAGIRRPLLSGDQACFRKAADRDLTKKKMTLALRIAARREHELLVLGALGCGAFRNPPGDVARCWLEVLEEKEFSGGWWREIWFAVFDTKGEGNFGVFEDVLGGREVGKIGEEVSRARDGENS